MPHEAILNASSSFRTSQIVLGDRYGATCAPEIINDLPAGGRRLVQKASGYDYTIVSGEVAFIKGEATGALNGRLIRNS